MRVCTGTLGRFLTQTVYSPFHHHRPLLVPNAIISIFAIPTPTQTQTYMLTPHKLKQPLNHMRGKLERGRVATQPWMSMGMLNQIWD